MNPENTREAKVAKIFLQNTEIDELFVTSDGFAFSKKSYAENHADSLKDKTVETFNRTGGDKVNEADLLASNVKNFTEKVQEIVSVEELEDLSSKETAGQNRKGIHLAIKERIEAIAFDAENATEVIADETGKASE